jgi:radical S-adenosyl methionine domain-containing protein 2
MSRQIFRTQIFIMLPSTLSLLLSSPIAIFATVFCILSSVAYFLLCIHEKFSRDAPISVNYHFSRRCNYECGFCFHTEKTSDILSIEDAKRGMKLLTEAGMKKLNFAGGEPFLYTKFMAELLRYGKQDLAIESRSIVSNGSKITEKFLRENAAFIDILAISCDSFNPETNIAIGRGKRGENVAQMTRIAGWCREFGIKFKINTVVNSLNWEEDMTAQITTFQPFRWKVFQCLIVTGENENEQRKRDARKFLVSEEQWKVFCDTHKHLECFVPESNEMMKGSYLILDEYMRFLDKGDSEEKASESILKVGVKRAMRQVRWDDNAFRERGGIYDWNKDGGLGCSSSGARVKELEF